MTQKPSEPQRTFDVFPANVTVSEQNYVNFYDINNVFPSADNLAQGSKYVNTARVIASRGVLYIAVDSSTGPVMFFREKFNTQTSDDRTTRFVTDSGRVIAVKKDKSCGCGSRLRNWHPTIESNQAISRGE